MNRLKQMFSARRFRAGGYATFAAAVVIAIAVLANMVVGALPADVTQIDVTSQALYTLSDQSRQIVRALDRDVTLSLLAYTGQEDESVTKLLDRYAALSDHVKVEYVDPAVNPTVLEKYKDEALYANSVIVTCGEKYRFVSYQDIFQTDYSNYYYNGSVETSFNGEGALTTIPIGRGVQTVFKCFPASLIPEKIGDFALRKLVVFFAVALIFKLLMDAYLSTKSGLLLRAAGNNPQYVKMLARDPGNMRILGLAIGNGYAAVSGALIAQSRANVNQSMGIGMIVIGLASLIIGLSLFGKTKLLKATTKVIIGSVIYQACLVIASLIGIPSSYNKLLMAVLFTLALVFSGFVSNKRGGGRND